ncbi:class I SAM-dependent methyltransferase [bacterium]|jgi:hypothetical protein|nr:class I SAM-dependent methyltransferase [bacterium]MBT6293328.1 class I SAM-dependent methyltransferase [bacterium]
MEIYKNPELFNLWRENHEKKSNEEVQFLKSILNNNIDSLLDIGGADGVHTIPLSKEMKKVEFTIYDGSEELIRNAKKKISEQNISNVKTQVGYFENIPQVLADKSFDAAISMWTTITYVNDLKKRKELYKWLSENIEKTIIIDQSNFYNYPESDLSKSVEIFKNYEIRTTRQYTMYENYLRTGSYTFNFKNLNTDEEHKIYDPEIVQFIEPKEIDKLLGSKWKRTNTFGSYDQKDIFDKKNSKRLITIHEQK